MTDQTKVQELVTKIQDLTWDRLEVAEEQTETKPSPMDSLVIDWIPDLIEEVIVDWHRPRVERWYIMPGLGPEAEAMMRTLRMLEIARDAEIINTTAGDSRTAVQALVDSVTGSFDTFFKACSAFFEIRVLCVWDEFIWKRERRKSMTDVGRADLHARRQAAIRDRQERLINSQLAQEYPSEVFNLGNLTKEEIREEYTHFREQWFREMHARIALCTPSRFRLTGRQ